MISDEVKRILAEVLDLNAAAENLSAETPLAGHLPEFDSMAAVAILTALEDQPVVPPTTSGTTTTSTSGGGGGGGGSCSVAGDSTLDPFMIAVVLLPLLALFGLARRRWNA